MIPTQHKNRRLPWVVIGVPALLGIVCFAGYAIIQYVRAETERRAAEPLLEQYEHTGRRIFLTQGREHLQACLRLNSQNARLQFLAARAARRDNDDADAQTHLRQAERLGWVREAIELEQALTRVQQGELDRYETVLRGFIGQSHPERAVILEALVHGYEKTYHLHEAAVYLDLWLKDEPDNAKAILERAEVNLLTNRPAAAKDDYRRGVELDPDADTARQRLGELLLIDQKADQALAYFEELRRRHPEDADALLGVARCKAMLDDQTGAIAVLDELLAQHPRHAAALAERGRLALAQGDFREAERFLRESVTLAPFEYQAIYAFCNCLQKNGKGDEAAKWSKRLDAITADRAKLDEVKAALRKTPYATSASLRAEMGRVLLRNGQDREALQWLRSAQMIDPSLPAVQEALAEYKRRKDTPGATP
jgi:predicted Zn-dependent protease